jgi:hypothetical protein
LVVHGVSAFADESWRSVDANRTQYLRSGTTVLVLPEMCAGKLEALAPNLASWIGGSVLGLRDEPAPLDPEAVESRLSELRAWSGLDDAEVLRQAEHGTLPLDPLYSEWMVLLRRGDLLVS